MATAHPRHHMTLRMERRDTRISGPRTHSASCDGPGAVPLLLYARPSLGPQPRALWSAARISAAAPRAPAGSHSVTNMQRSKSFVSGSDGSHRSCRYVIVCCRMPTGAGPGPRHCQPESRRLPPLSRPSQSMPVTSGAYGGQRRSAVSAPRSALSELPRRCERQRPARAEQPLEAKPLKGACVTNTPGGTRVAGRQWAALYTPHMALVPSNLRSTSKSAPQPSGPPPPGGPPAPTPASTSASRIDRLSSQTLPEPVAVAVPPPTPKPNSVTWDCMLRPNDLTCDLG